MNNIAHLQRNRAIKNRLAYVVALLTTGLTLFFLCWILTVLFQKGIHTLNWKLFTEITPPPGSVGGLINAIVGSFLMVSFATLAGGIIGILIVIYFSEYGRHSRLTKIARFINDILLTAPSVILGLFVYGIYVAKVGHFSGYAGIVALMIIAIPIIIRATDNVFSLFPTELREAAVAIGAPTWKIVLKIMIPITKSGIITGVILAIARISGETAPLLFTALNNQFWTLDLNKPISSLPVVIFQFAMSPYKHWQDLAWSGALFLTMIVFMLNITVRLLFRQKIVLH